MEKNYNTQEKQSELLLLLKKRKAELISHLSYLEQCHEKFRDEEDVDRTKFFAEEIKKAKDELESYRQI